MFVIPNILAIKMEFSEGRNEILFNVKLAPEDGASAFSPPFLLMMSIHQSHVSVCSF